MVYPPVTQFETRALRVAAQLPLRVVVGEDNVLLRTGTVRVLQAAGFDVVADAGEPSDLLRKVRAHRPDVAVTDDAEAAIAIRRHLPAVALLVVSDDPRPARALLKDG